MPDQKVLFVSTRLSHPITAWRIEMLQSHGFDVETVGFERPGFYGRLPSVPYATLGRLRDNAYLRRLPALLRAVPRIRAAIRRCSLVYVNGGDTAFAVIAARGLRRVPVVREVPDIERILLSSGLIGRFYRSLDRFIERRCRLLVLTSPEYRVYYRDWLRLEASSIVVENKVEPGLADVWRRLAADGSRQATGAGIPLADRPLKIGCFAQIRDQWALDCLEHLTKIAGDSFEVVIAGVVTPDIEGFEQFQQRNPAIDYRGPYRHPDDLGRLYSEVDMQMAAIAPGLSHDWSRTCRFYDSCALRTPLVVRAGTADAAQVEQHRIGAVLKQARPQDAASELARLTADDWLEWRSNMDALSPEVYALSDEGDNLAAALNALTVRS